MLDSRFIALEGIVLTSTQLKLKDLEIPLSDIVRVAGGQSRNTINFVRIEYRSWVRVDFKGTPPLFLSEERKYLGSARHDAIFNLYRQLLQLTFGFRLARSLEEFRMYGFIELTEDIELTHEGEICTKDQSFDLRKAYADGTLGFGSIYRSLNGRRTTTDSGEIIVSEKSPSFGKFIPRRSLRFRATTLDADVAEYLIQWVAKSDGDVFS